MRIKKNFICREIGGQFFCISVGTENQSNALLLNETAKTVWDAISEGRDPVVALTDTYEVDRETACADAEETIALLRQAGALEE